LIFFGNERLATGLADVDTPVISALVDAGYEIAAVIANYEKASSRSVRRLEIADFCKQNNIPIMLPDNLANVIDDIKSLDCDLAVLVAYGKIIPRGIIDLFSVGIINIHPSLLPLYRGPTPIEQVILDGVDKTGVSIMKLSAGMDDGPVYAQKEVGLQGEIC
jgi:methionyl-tRNA formyltransferase